MAFLEKINKNNGFSFLIPEEQDLFKRVGRVFKRNVIYNGLANSVEKTQDPKELVYLISSRLEALIKLKKKWFKCFCVSVNKDDGRTWSAEIVKTGIPDSFSHYNLWCLSDHPSPGGLPLIANFVGEKKFLKIAKDFGLTEIFFH